MKSGSLAICFLLAACGTAAADTKRIRPTQWAQPVLGSEVRNWHCVSPELYRCAQPDDDGMRELAAFGIRSVVNLSEVLQAPKPCVVHCWHGAMATSR